MCGLYVRVAQSAGHQEFPTPAEGTACVYVLVGDASGALQVGRRKPSLEHLTLAAQNLSSAHPEIRRNTAITNSVLLSHMSSYKLWLYLEAEKWTAPITEQLAGSPGLGVHNVGARSLEHMDHRGGGTKVQLIALDDPMHRCSFLGPEFRYPTRARLAPTVPFQDATAKPNVQFPQKRSHRGEGHKIRSIHDMGR